MLDVSSLNPHQSFRAGGKSPSLFKEEQNRTTSRWLATPKFRHRVSSRSERQEPSILSPKYQEAKRLLRLCFSLVNTHNGPLGPHKSTGKWPGEDTSISRLHCGVRYGSSHKILTSVQISLLILPQVKSHMPLY